ncbi:hypothetical protein ACROYT_G024413 [Oculina patagonica]
MAETIEPYQQSRKMQLRRRSKLKKPQPYSPSSSPDTNEAKTSKQLKKRKRDDDYDDEHDDDDDKETNKGDLAARFKKMCKSIENDDVILIPDDDSNQEPVKNKGADDKRQEKDKAEVKTIVYEVTPQMVEEKVTAMKGYLLDIASAPPSEDTPPPHLERHQAWLLLGGYQKWYKDLETFTLGGDTFSYDIIPDVMRLINDMFQTQRKPTVGFTPLMACMDTFLKYDFPDFVLDKCYYVTHVLTYEALTKLIMDMEDCSYEEATGIGLDIGEPTKTPYGLEWNRLIKERNERRELAKRRQSKRKQQTPKRRKTLKL